MTQLSLTRAQWVLEPLSSSPANDLDLSPIAARCLALRVGSDQVPTDLLAPPSLRQLHDPFQMHNMDIAIDRLHRAIRDRQSIRIITDYDVDGTTSSLILQAALRLRERDLSIDYHIPNRFDEGYGFSVKAAQSAAEAGRDLIVTADIGVRDHAAVAAARNAGLDVLICDHHLPAGESVPEDATVLCPPQSACSYPNRSLAACGVSLKLAQALLQDHRQRDAILMSMLKLAAVGTVADLVPLTTAENRAIVSLGLQQLNGPRHHPGLDALLKVCDLKPGQIGEGDLGFRVGPRINAAGRVADAKLVVELLNCRDHGRAQELAGTLDKLNRERRDIQRTLTARALKQAAGEPASFVVVAGQESEGWHRGVVGIVASKVKDETHRPTAVLSIQGEYAVGSVRSISAIHAVHALDSVADILVRYGGHPAAAGFTVPVEHIDALRTRLGEYVDAHTDSESLIRKRRVDALAEPSDLTEDLHRELSRLGPFGMGNPRPKLQLTGVRVVDARALGADGATLKFKVPRRFGGPIDCIWFGQGHRAQDLPETIDILGTLSINEWRGRRSLQIDVTDLRAHSLSNR